MARYGDTELPSHTVKDEWEQFKETFEVKKKRTRLSIGVCTTTARSRVWFDDVAVILVKPARR